jgi:hypothetical protein
VLKIKFEPSWDHAFNFDRDEHDIIGHLASLTIGPEVTLAQDIHIQNPFDFSTITVAGVIKLIEWDGKPADVLTVNVLVSTSNKQALTGVAYKGFEEDPAVTLDFTVYDYDYAAQKYFRAFALTSDDPLKGTIAKMNDGTPTGNRAVIDMTIAAAPEKTAGGQTFSPQVWSVEFKVNPGSTTQNLRWATGSKQKVIKKWGVPKNTTTSSSPGP